jgi:beta-lactamase regulating signal transducer with metallopeptidase domain
MSIISAIIVGLLLLIRLVLGKWIKKTLLYALWGIVLFRLLIPISISSKYNLINMVNPNFAKAIAVSKPNEISEATYSATNVIQLANDYNPIKYNNSKVEKIFNICGIIWSIGMCISFVIVAIFYTITLKQLNRAVKFNYDKEILNKCKNKINVKRKIKVYESSIVNTPIVCGIIRPKIIVPLDIDKKNLEYIFLHELVHIRHKDNIWRFLSVLGVSLHWFNPFAWLFFMISQRDMEIACDETVLRKIPHNNRKNYAMSIIDLANNQILPFTALGNTAIKQRLFNIVSYKKIPIIMSIGTLIICIIITILLITNPLTY